MKISCGEHRKKNSLKLFFYKKEFSWQVVILGQGHTIRRRSTKIQTYAKYKDTNLRHTKKTHKYMLNNDKYMYIPI